MLLESFLRLLVGLPVGFVIVEKYCCDCFLVYLVQRNFKCCRQPGLMHKVSLKLDTLYKNLPRWNKLPLIQPVRLIHLYYMLVRITWFSTVVQIVSSFENLPLLELIVCLWKSPLLLAWCMHQQLQRMLTVYSPIDKMMYFASSLPCQSTKLYEFIVFPTCSNLIGQFWMRAGLPKLSVVMRVIIR